MVRWNELANQCFLNETMVLWSPSLLLSLFFFVLVSFQSIILWDLLYLIRLWRIVTLFLDKCKTQLDIELSNLQPNKRMSLFILQFSKEILVAFYFCIQLKTHQWIQSTLYICTRRFFDRLLRTLNEAFREKLLANICRPKPLRFFWYLLSPNLSNFRPHVSL